MLRLNHYWTWYTFKSVLRWQSQTHKFNKRGMTFATMQRSSLSLMASQHGKLLSVYVWRTLCVLSHCALYLQILQEFIADLFASDSFIVLLHLTRKMGLMETKPLSQKLLGILGGRWDTFQQGFLIKIITALQNCEEKIPWFEFSGIFWKMCVM